MLVHSFEPIPDTYCRLKRNVASNSLSERCVLNCLAVGKRLRVRDVQSIRVTRHNRIHSQQKRSVTGRMSHFNQVPTVSLDSYCEKLGITGIDFLKIDVEGMEPNVLDGAVRLLASKLVHSILIEICPLNLIEAGFSTTDLYDKILVLGYHPFSLAQDGTVGSPMSCFELSAITLGNVLLLPT